MFFIYRTRLLDDLDCDKREINKEFDFAVLNKEEFEYLSDEEKIKYCYGITKGFQSEYTIDSYIDDDDIDVDDPYLLDWIENLLKEEERFGIKKYQTYKYYDTSKHNNSITENFSILNFSTVCSSFPDII